MAQTESGTGESASGLRAIMRSLIRTATDRPGLVGRITLAHGIEIAVLCREAGHGGKAGPGWVSVQLARAGVAPSPTEIRVVCAALPFEVDAAPQPKMFFSKGKHYARLTFGWPRPEPAQLPLSAAPIEES